MCLYGHPDESWEVNPPPEEVPPELPEPALGINFARDGMKRQDWLSLIAVHSDSWLLSVSFYLGARLNRNERFIVLFLELIADVFHEFDCLSRCCGVGVVSVKLVCNSSSICENNAIGFLLHSHAPTKDLSYRHFSPFDEL